MINTFSRSLIIWEPAIKHGPIEWTGGGLGNELGARRAEQFPHIGNYMLTPDFNHWHWSTVNIILTSSGSFNSATRCSMVLSCWKRWTFSGLMAHFQMAPVAAVNSSLLSVSQMSSSSGSSPPYLRIRSRVSFSSAHWTVIQTNKQRYRWRSQDFKVGGHTGDVGPEGPMWGWNFWGGAAQRAPSPSARGSGGEM